jgi:membrane-associated phospholipid phosphatase
MGGWQPRVGRPLLPGPARAGAAWVIAGCAVLVAALGVLFAHQRTADGFDKAIDAPVIGWLSGQPHLRLWLAWPGTITPAAVLVVAVAAGCLLAGRLNGALLTAVAVPAATGLDEAVLKPLAGRTYLGSLAYPSGHVTTVAALAAALSVLLLVPPQPAGSRARLPRILFPALAWAVTIVVAVAVISLRWHYFTDTLAGAAVGTGTAALLALLIDLSALRRGLDRLCRAWPGPDPAGCDPAGPPPGQRRTKS